MAANTLVSISTACSARGRYDVLGIVVDSLPIYRTRGSSKCVTFTIKDSDFDKPTWSGGLKIKYFNDDESALPNTQVGDAVFLRNIQVTTYQSKLTGVVTQHETVKWIIFRPESAPGSSPFIISGPVPFDPSLWERDQAQSILDRVSAESNSVQQSNSRSLPAPSQTTHVQASHPIPKRGGLPFTLIKDAIPGQLYQLLGQVVKINTFDSGKCLLYISDYTENAQLADYKKPGEEDDSDGPAGDSYRYITQGPKDWPGPWGQLVIQVTLWDPHGGYARENLKPGDLVLLTYTRIKQGQNLEASVHEDRRYPEKIHVRIVKDKNDERVQALMDRRAEYWKIHGEPKKDTKKDTKKTKKQTKQSEQQKKAHKEEGQLTLVPSTGTKTNGNVKTTNYTVPRHPVEKILLAESHTNNGPGGVVYQLPFQNVTYRSTVRVIDFFPPKLEDFAVQTAHVPLYSGEDNTIEPENGWEWRFCLLVEGIGPKQPNRPSRETMKLYVIGQDGDYLMNEEAANLHSDTRRLSRIREKLFVLWGNLEEEKMKAMTSGNSTWGPVSSVPFDCCIKEYGVHCTHAKDSNAMDVDGQLCNQNDCFGWERRFAIFDTTIHAS